MSSFYPTYEEWKHWWVERTYKKEYTFYPTYEEWKHTYFHTQSHRFPNFLSYLWGMETWNPNGSLVGSWTFYPTYEEWKHSTSRRPSSRTPHFLSYLWGMETISHENESATCKILFILPMRNGNADFDNWFNDWFSFLSYLWGMETWFVYCNYNWFKSFLSYLWGMETVKFFQGLLLWILLFILPMRNGNLLSINFLFCSW